MERALQAANAGGVAVSGLEMSQNAMRLQWTSEEVDKKLKVCRFTLKVYHLRQQCLLNDTQLSLLSISLLLAVRPVTGFSGLHCDTQ